MDGAIFSYLKAVGFGDIMKDEKERVVATLSKKLHALSGATEA